MEVRHVILISFSSLRKANAAADLLKAEDIPCFVDFEGVFGAFVGQTADKGFHLVVEENDVRDARDVLQLDGGEGEDFRW